MRAVIFSGITVVAACAAYGGLKLAKAFDARQSTPVQSVREPDYALARKHLDNAVDALTPIEGHGTFLLFGFELDNGRNARPAAARSELEAVLQELPDSPARKAVKDVYDRLPDTAISSSAYQQERKTLRALADSFSRP